MGRGLDSLHQTARQISSRVTYLPACHPIMHACLLLLLLLPIWTSYHHICNKFHAPHMLLLHCIAYDNQYQRVRGRPTMLSEMGWRDFATFPTYCCLPHSACLLACTTTTTDVYEYIAPPRFYAFVNEFEYFCLLPHDDLARTTDGGVRPAAGQIGSRADHFLMTQFPGA